MVKLRGSPRWEVAIRDAELAFPAAADTFACSLGFTVTEEDTPALYMLLRRTLADIGLATYPAKKSYQRQRPFMINGKPVCARLRDMSTESTGQRLDRNAFEPQRMRPLRCQPPSLLSSFQGHGAR